MMAAQLSLRPPLEDNNMVSQQLPSITCSTCAQPIPLDALSEHICSGPPLSQSPRTPPAATTVSSSNNYSSPSSMGSRRLAPPQNHPSSAPRSPSPLRANASPPTTRPSFDQPRPSFDQPRPSFDQSQVRPSFDSQRPPPPRSPFQEHMANARPPQQSFPTAPAPDTKTGGTAGMAGVGRRGFAAAAAAAMFTVAHPQPHRQFVDMKPPILNIPEPISPPVDPRAPSPYGHSSNHGHGSSHGHGSDQGHQQQAPLSPIGDARQRRPSAAERPKGDTAPVKTSDPSSPTQEPRPKQSLESSATRSTPKLAYLDGTVSSKDFNFSPTNGKHGDAEYENFSPRDISDLGKDKGLNGGPSRDGHAIDFPKRRASVTESLYSTSSRGHKVGASLERSLSSPYESTSSPSLSNSTHPTSAGSSGADHLKVQAAPHPTRSNTSPSLSRPDKPLKDQPTTRRRSEKKCVKCGKKITDGKWVQVDSTDSSAPSVLCEYDWKMLYLPKCRRCDKPIEGQAIGSADGQIKGKYHRDCFNCTSCQKPFPDKSFYVFDGKPFCEYHYHEANNSLCASPRCGLPIEGPCAVAHNGDRYHPEHFICESSTCKERLHDEYWEVDGTRLCDRHARLHPMFEDASTIGGHGGPADDDRVGEPRDSLASISSYDAGNASFGRAQKRMTRYVDL